ncbi:hypothetical protein GWR56_06860 [Mucilaginibacter sp. 14171R-50]|uniref:hypothetical protein n=1 Tax=Mucilaginibacter sp. 14171R-50 TaxID=2703789 RepID=UPI00138DBBB9|nr:hypothetical protein [Mucilaginibacter sp. 14171R-50]QHS55274.1 hypothetical protein GWR56_06860 [Mucilaginibacter sp. 14171R-50]
MIYNLYKKASGDDAGQVLAIIGHHDSDVIDAFEVYRITNDDPIQVEVFKDKDIKVYGAGRPIWSEITWTLNEKWDLIKTELDLAKITEAIKANPAPEAISSLVSYFGK